ncbi:Type III effector HopA1 [Pseudomonas amygdali pv. ulmi]|nr:T3SS effector HopA1 family protein [Pseudomonas amygdali]RMR24186.1 Type III effector HopA1 [Pseudomonas amygdali pv. ulmi]
MNPIQTRFSNVEALRHSEVDVQELKAHGQIEVGGKCYDIRAAANNDLTVQRSDKQMTMSKFFKKAGLSGSSGSQSDQIAQVLNEKRGPAGPRLIRQGQTHLGRMPLNIEEGQGSSATTSVQKSGLPNGRLVNSSILQWAEKAKANGNTSSGALYQIYAKELPRVELLPRAEHRACLAHMYKQNAKDGISIWPQFLDGVRGVQLKHDTKEFMMNNPKAADEFYKIERSGAQFPDEAVKARLTINVKPQFQKAMVDAAVRLTAERHDIITAKVAGPAKIGTLTDAAVFYVGGDFSSAQTLAKELQALLPEDAFINHTPAGMQSMGKGMCYAERTPQDRTSHGMSRASIIESALADTSRLSLEKKLRNAFKSAGYNPDNPAFRLE